MLCHCLPRYTSNTGIRNHQSCSQTMTNEKTRGGTTVRSLQNHKHGILWQIEDILGRQCNSKDRQRLLTFTKKILTVTETEIVRSTVSKSRSVSESAFLQIILEALPAVEECKADRRDLIKALEMDGINMANVSGWSNDTPLLTAIRLGNRGALDALLHTTHCDINATDRHSTTCLVHAVQRNDCETVRTILTRFATAVNLDKTDYANYTALAHAASNNNIELCTLLLDAGARPDVNSTSPLFLAVRQNCSYNLIALLISRGSSVNVSNADGLTALSAAAKNQQPNIVSLLLDSGAIFSPVWHKNSAFGVALGTDNVAIVKTFLRHGVEIQSTNTKGASIIHECCCHGSVNILSLVTTTTDIDLDSRNRQRQTAAHLAVQFGHRQCLKALFLAGADCWSTEPHRGHSALQMALFNNHFSCASFFLKYPVFPRQSLFSTMYVLTTRYDPEALRRKPAIKSFASALNVMHGEDRVDSLFTTSIITIRQLLGQNTESKVIHLPLPKKIKEKILSFRK